MHALLKRLAAFGLVATALTPGCREKVTATQCEALVTRYAELVVRDKMPGATDEVIRNEQKLVREEAKSDEDFRNCTTEIGPKEYACAMAAATPEAVEKCLE